MSKDPGYLDPKRRGWKGSSKDVLEVKKVKKSPSVTSEADSTSCSQPGAKIRNSTSTANIISEDVKEYVRKGIIPEIPGDIKPQLQHLQPENTDTDIGDIGESASTHTTSFRVFPKAAKLADSGIASTTTEAVSALAVEAAARSVSSEIPPLPLSSGEKYSASSLGKSSYDASSNAITTTNLIAPNCHSKSSTSSNRQFITSTSTMTVNDSAEDESSVSANSGAPTSLLSSKRPRLKSDNASDNCNDNEHPPEDEDTPIDLAATKATSDERRPSQNPPSISNGAAPLATSSDGLSAKMRLKRQIRALAEAAAIAEAASAASETGATSGSGNALEGGMDTVAGSGVVTSRTLSCSSSGSSSASSPSPFTLNLSSATGVSRKRPFDPQTSALHQLAEAAELKQEEELLEMNGVGSSHRLAHLQQQRFSPPSSQNQSLLSQMPPISGGAASTGSILPKIPLHLRGIISTPLVPRSEYEVATSSSNLLRPQLPPPLITTDSRGPVLLASLPTTPLPPTASLLRQAGATSAALDLSSPPFSGGAARLSPPPAAPTQLPHPGVGHPLLHAPGPEPQDAVGGGQPSLNASSNPAGISRQQLINSPCPICGDKISGFHYGIFSCESCKGFFKRTVQNKKNYVCLRGAQCPVSISTRKKCPACRFDKCLKTGMKLEAIREDRTRGGRSTYQCSYPNSTVPSLQPMGLGGGNGGSGLRGRSASPELVPASLTPAPISAIPRVIPRTFSASDMTVLDNQDSSSSSGGGGSAGSGGWGSRNNSGDGYYAATGSDSSSTPTPPLPPLAITAPNPFQQSQQRSQASQETKPTMVPPLMKEIMDVEHLWFSSQPGGAATNTTSNLINQKEGGSDASEDQMVETLANMADKRLYKLVKWCKSLPLFKNIVIDDQIALLINAWCELLVFSCCYRSINSPGLVRVSNEKSLSLASARHFGIDKCVDKMLNFTEQLRRLKVDHYEYVSMKVIVLLTSDASGLKEAEHVRNLQERLVRELQQYTTANYPTMPSKFADLLLRVPELHRVCQVGREMLTPQGGNSDQGESPGFNLLMELLRGDH